MGEVMNITMVFTIWPKQVGEVLYRSLVEQGDKSTNPRQRFTVVSFCAPHGMDLTIVDAAATKKTHVTVYVSPYLLSRAFRRSSLFCNKKGYCSIQYRTST